MKFAAVALLGAIYLADQVEGRRGKDYDITRAYAMCDTEGKVKLA